VICTIIKTTSLHSPTNFLILGLAISDWGVGLFGQPVYIVTLFYELYDDSRYYCKVYDIFYGILWIVGSTSLLTLSALTTDRFFAVFSHLKYAEIVTSSRVGISLLVIWVYSIGCWLIFFFISEKIIFFHDVVIFVAVVVNIIFIIKINHCIRRHLLQIQAQQQAVQQPLNIQTLKKSINPMYYMFGAFVVWFIPSYANIVAKEVLGYDRIEVRISFKVSELLFLLNSLANPLIYFWRIAALRTASWDLLRSLFQKLCPFL